MGEKNSREEIYKIFNLFDVRSTTRLLLRQAEQICDTVVVAFVF